MLVTTWCSFDNDDKRPWTYGITEAWPEYHTACLQWMFDNYPEVKTCAHAAQDEEVSWMSTAALEAVCEVNDVELVYNRLYSVETIDFAPIVSAMLATKPDMLSFVGAYPEFRAACMEQAYLQGFSGPIYVAEYEQTMILEKVPVEFVQDTISSHPKMNDPMVPAACHDFYNKWMARFGPGAPEDVHAEMYLLDYYSYETLKIWQWAVEQAGSVEPAAVKAIWDTADSNPDRLGRQIPGHLYGEATWWGEGCWGIEHALLVPVYVNKATMPNGDPKTMAVVDVAGWIMEHEDVFIKHMENWGCMYYQRD
jgi:branched-chain amino acid transport system substrate-binding protein